MHMHTPDTAAYHMCLVYLQEEWGEEKDKERQREPNYLRESERKKIWSKMTGKTENHKYNRMKRNCQDKKK